jgi:hypothetical protein
MTDTKIEQRCRACGHHTSGKFCSNCGEPINSREPEGWTAVASDILGGQPGLLNIVAGLALHPIRTTVALAEDSRYTRHWRLFTLSLTVSLFISWIFVPHLASWLRNEPPAQGESMVRLWEGSLIALLVLEAPILYYICRWVGRTERTPRSYFKFWTLVAAYVVFVASLAGLGMEFVHIAMAHHLVSLEPKRLEDAYGVIILALVLFVGLSHRKFWHISWLAIYWVALIIFIVSATMLALVVGPIALAFLDIVQMKS